MNLAFRPTGGCGAPALRRAGVAECRGRLARAVLGESVQLGGHAVLDLGADVALDLGVERVVR